MRKIIRGYRGEIFLEIGAGSGSNLKDSTQNFGLLVGTEIGEVSALHHPRIQLIKADVATCFRDSIFDIVAFNPPYLPSEATIDRTTDGGRGGIEVAKRFLSDARRVLRREGKILMLLSSLCDTHGMEEYCISEGLFFRVVAEEHLFFERLLVYEVSETSKDP